MNARFEDILDNCIYLIKSGQDTIEGCLERHAEIRQELEPLLRMAICVQDVPPVSASHLFKAQARQRLLGAVEAKRLTSAPRWFPFMSPEWANFGRLLVRAVAVLVVAALLGSGVVAASAKSLPGSLLYPVKVAAERVQMVLTFDKASRAKLNLKFVERRLGEVKALTAKSRGKNIARPLLEMNRNLEEAQKEGSGVSGEQRQKVLQKIIEITERQQTVLKSVRAKVPEQAKDAVSHALEVSRRGHKQAQLILKQQRESKEKPGRPEEPRRPEKLYKIEKPEESPRPREETPAKQPGKNGR